MKKAMYKLEELLGLGGTKKDIVFLAIGLVSLIFSLFNVPLPFDAAWISVIFCGIPIVLEAVIGLVTAFDIKADVLVSLALIASICIGEIFAAGEVAFIMQLGGLLEELTVNRARAGIENLVKLTPQTARIIMGDSEKTVAAEEVNVGDIIKVLPGETVPVDGIIISGQTSVNQAVMTGESLPVDKHEGDKVSSGFVNQFGAFTMRAEKACKDSSIQRMIRLVESADAGKAKSVRTADRWATWIVVIALSAAILTWIFTGEIIRSVTILVVFCPCALVLATPTAVMAAIGNATKHGFLVKEGDALEKLSKVKKITFDKTGTLTYGTPEVIHFESLSADFSDNEIFSLCASAESNSEHPLGQAVVRCFKKSGNGEIPTCEEFAMVPGRGVAAKSAGYKVMAGNLKMLKEDGVSIPDGIGHIEEKFLNQGCTVIYIAADKVLSGYIVLSDTVRGESRRMIGKLKSLDAQPVLLTGDNENAAKAIAGQLGISEVHASCLPEDKLNIIEGFQKEGLGVCMMGDGINDAPALKQADVGIAMGGIGSDIAVDAADIALADDRVEELPHLIALSKRMMKVIKMNISFSMGLNFLAMGLAIFGALSPVIGALVHNAGSVIVIIHSAFLLRWKQKER